jgi:hypothetical protein
MGKPPDKKISEAEALLMIARELGRLADAAEIMAAPPHAEPRVANEADEKIPE